MNRFSKGAVIAIVAIAVAAGLWRRCARVEQGIAVTAPIGRIADCGRPRAYAEAARRNAASLTSADWSVFGRPETGWSIYAPLVAHEIGARCGADTPAFARALGAWQGRHGEPPGGAMDAATLDALRLVWLERRPFLAESSHGSCPPAAPDAALVTAAPQDGYEGMTIRMRPQALAAWRAMVAAARAETPEIAANPRLLTIFSGYRDPAADEGRCAAGGCGRISRARCSAHRTGLALDIYLGSAPGFPPESTADANRLYQSQSPAYHWLVANAGRFGFVNYPFEPWHWEWTGSQPRPRQP